MGERQTCSIIKAGELVGVSRRTIYNWLSSGKLDTVRTAGGCTRIFVDSLWRDPKYRPVNHNLRVLPEPEGALPVSRFSPMKVD